MVRWGGIVSIITVFLFSTWISVSAKEGFGPGEQEYGYVDVRKGAHMFYWLYYTTANVSAYTDRPLAIWLQGGPGASSTGYGNFEELGPLTLSLKPRNHTWVKDMNVLFIDNPVGSGFSYVDNVIYLTKSNKQIALDLVELMKGFYNLHPEFKSVPLHIFCESYGGKMAPEFALYLYKAIQNNEIESNLQSVSLGDPWVSPIDSVNAWAPLLLNMGIIDNDGYNKIMKSANETETALDNGKYTQSTLLWGNTQGILLDESKGVDFYNILLPTNGEAYARSMLSTEDRMFRTLVNYDIDEDRDKILQDLMRGPVSKALNIPSKVIWGSQSGSTFTVLMGDFMKPVIDVVETLLNSTTLKVSVFSGQLDLICATPGTVNWINKMNWINKTEYESAPRKGIVVNRILEGYQKEAGNFSMFWVDRAGHMVPNDNPRAMDFILKKYTQYDKNVSSVSEKEGFGPGEQDYGYVDVRKGAHMFYWLYFTTANVSAYTDRPLAIWLQGGPGASSTGYGNFEELGPLTLSLKPRNHTWVKDMNVLFIDNPVGSGFSYVDDVIYLTKSNKQIASDLVEFMKGFYNLHPEFKSVPLHIFCESYGGKMAPEFALYLYKAIQNNEIESNLQSVSLGDPWVSPIDSVNAWAPLLLNMGIIDNDGYNNIMESANETETALDNGKYTQSTLLWGKTQGILLDESKGVDFYNILLPTNGEAYARSLLSTEDRMFRTLVNYDIDEDRDKILQDLMRGPVSKALNIPSKVVWGSQSGSTFNNLMDDFMKPVIDVVETLLNSTTLKVSVFSGQLDLICATPGTVNWINKMNWINKTEYESAPRKGIVVNRILEGYQKEAGNFSMFWVDRAGHMVPNDNPRAMNFILKKYTKYDQNFSLDN